jgi:hypothetical protein
MGRLADGASGMSSGFCCASTAAASNETPIITSQPVFLLIPHLYLSDLYLIVSVDNFR